MCKVSYQTGSDSGSSCSLQSGGVGISDERFGNIKAANRKVRLINILRHYGLKIEKNPQRPTWSNNIICPLPNHKGSKERTPSFGYCFVTDHFCCLGCRQSGRSVEFISLYESISRTAVADRILAQYGEDVSSEEFDNYQDELLPLLLNSSAYIQKLIQQHKNDNNKLKQIDKLVWWIDFYIIHKSITNDINKEDLEHRLNKVKEILDEMFNIG